MQFHDANHDAEPQPQGTAGMSGSILVVDDDADTRELIVDALVRRGLTATHVPSGADALEAIRHQEVDAVVTDFQLGGMSGIELCRRLSELRPDVPVIVLTGHGNMELAISAIRAGAYDFITKPISEDVLGLAVARALQHRLLKYEVGRLREAVSNSTTKKPANIV